MNIRVIMKRMSQLFLIVICFFVVIGCSSKDKGDLEDIDAAQVVEYLVEGGPISNLLPSGFEAVLPVNGTPIRDGVSRANGINILDSDAVDLINSQAVTIYYPAQYGEKIYYVPVTQHIEADDLNYGIVEALLNRPTYESRLLHVFNPNVELVNVNVSSDGVLKVEFYEEILADVNEAYIADEVIETLVLTLTDQPDISGVSIAVENIEQIFNEHGIPYSEPVTRESFVPTGSF